MKQIKQFRYYGARNAKNQPTELSKANLVSGSAFANNMPIIQLGIQSLPGTQFYLNGSRNPIIIGTTGIFELDLNGIAEINALSFDGKSIDVIANANQSQPTSAFLIVDIIYEDGVN